MTRNIDRVLFTSKAYEKHLSFWRKIVEQNDENFFFTQQGSSSIGGAMFNRFSSRLSDQAATLVSQLGNHTDAGNFTILLSAFLLFLHKATGKHVVVLDTPLLRNSVTEVFAPFTLLQVDVDNKGTIKDHLIKVQNTVRDAYTYHNFPLSVVTDRNPEAFTNVLFSYEPLHVSIVEGMSQDLLVTASKVGDQIALDIRYNVNVFEDFAIEGLPVYLNNILAAFTRVDARLSEVSLWTDTELREWTKRINGEDRISISQDSIVSLFCRQCEAHGSKTAVVSDDVELTYQQLFEQSRSLAVYLTGKHNVQKGDLIGLMIERSPAMIVGVLGILMAGCAYVPLDTQFPASRKTFTLDDGNIRFLLTDHASLYDVPPDFKGNVVVLDESLLSGASDKAWRDPTTGSDLAYVLYTSGSSGQPKGVMIDHQCVVNLACDQIDLLNISAADRILQFAPLTFDASVWEIFNALLSGASLMLLSIEKVRESPALLVYLRQKGVTIAGLAAAFYNALDTESLNFLRVIMTGGDVPNLAKSIENSRHLKRFNAYGPTECCVNTTTYQITPKEEGMLNAPIGKSISNIKVQILNENMDSVPAGFPGEICVSGVGVARGYLNNPELTHEKFVTDPKRHAERVYRTGDMGRALRDGNLVFLRRRDRQVKIRGFRIDLQEIENALVKMPLVQEAVVLSREHHNSRTLAAYLRTQAGIPVPEIRKHLAALLPHYMLPSYYILLDEFPLMSHGKIDENILHSLSLQSATSTSNYVAPRTDTETKLVEIFRAVLQLEAVGVKDNFFDVGGDSIKAVEAYKLIENSFPAVIKIADLFVATDIEFIGRLIDTALAKEQPAGTPAAFKRLEI